MKKQLFFLPFALHIAAHPKTQAVNELVYQIRNPKTEAYEFRFALKKIGEYLALDVLEDLEKTETSICTLTGVETKHELSAEIPVLIPILRAGLPLNDGVAEVFRKSEIGFLAMARDEKTLKVATSYIAHPNLKDRVVIIVDTMVATGGSILDAIERVKTYHPKKIFVIAAIASCFGMERISSRYPEVKVFAAAVDPFLNDRGYIIPGLGDAGDRAYGEKYTLTNGLDEDLKCPEENFQAN